MQPQECEYLPLSKLVKLGEQNFCKSNVMKRARHSSLYRDQWAKSGIKPEEIHTYEELKHVPYISGKDLKHAEENYPPDELICCENVRLWISTSGTSGKPKWIPQSDRDFAIRSELGKRNAGLFREPFKSGEIGMGFTSPGPGASDSLPYISVVSLLPTDINMENITANYDKAQDMVTFALTRHPTIFQGFPSFVMHDVFSKIKDQMQLKYGLFFGEPLDPYREILIKNFGLEPYEVYGLSEFLGSTMDCWAHAGLHVWLDYCIPEIIPEDELEKEKTDSTYVPKATPLWETSAGDTGEYVLTTFGDALPLIRYRVSDMIEVVSTAKCECGRTHPRIRVLHRSDDIVNLGLLRVSLYVLRSKLEEIPQISRWQLRVGREGYKPKVTLLIEPTENIGHDTNTFIQTIRNKILEIEVLRIGVENNLIVGPQIDLVDKLAHNRTGTGKLKLVVYDKNYARTQSLTK